MSAAPNTRVQRTRSSASPAHSPLTRHPLGSPWTPGTRVAAYAVVLMGSLAVLASPEKPERPGSQLIYIETKNDLVVPREPAILSISHKNVIHWAGNKMLQLSFPVEDFPVLSDGTKVSLPPLTGMTLNTSKTRWFTGGSGVADGGSVNPALSPLLPLAKDNQLIYRYRMALGGAVAHGILIVRK